MKMFKNILATIIPASFLFLAMPSCIDFNYDAIKPRVDSTTLAANTTIAELIFIRWRINQTYRYQH